MPIEEKSIRETVISHPELERDRNSRAILNRNRGDYVARRNHRFSHRRREQEFSDLKKQVADLTALVNSLVSVKS